MTSCTCKYIDYNCYYCLKNKFHFCEVTPTGRTYLNRSLESMDKKINNFNSSNEHLIWIIKHLTCNSVFLHINTNIACKYINFLLNEKVKTLYPYDYNIYYKYFEDFVKKFFTVVEGDYKHNQICTTNINLLEDVEYKKMDILNTLYKEYDKLKNIHQSVYIQWKTCEIIDYIIKEANAGAELYKEYDKLKNIHQLVYIQWKTCEIIDYIIKEANAGAELYKNDYEFINVLRGLRDIIKKGDGKYEKFCATKLQQLDRMVREDAYPDKKPDTPTHTDISQSSVTLEHPKLQALAQDASENRIGKQSQASVDLHERLHTKQLRSNEEFTQVSHEISPSEAQHHRGSSLGESHRARSRHAEDPQENVFESSTFSREPNELSLEAHSRSVHTGYNTADERYTTERAITPTDGTQSYLETFKGTITGVLGSVDPGPVLGVSGGMGVLFILFKYTPFGSFFGKRRGRFRQIPSFRGLSPGEIPNFHEYRFFQINIFF
ncbi:PIR protein [Plasmodium vivax]|uniref:VIR protein n=1 Tax=Plasmodium vivax TaxID=5855 RepID=A0A565A4T9_PLAVI|nr:PIR protein [Plasmodium vivax]